MEKTEFRHTVRKQSFDISIRDQSMAHKIQSGISNLQETRVQKILDTVFTQYANPNCIYQFDQIALDLGSIRQSNYEEELLLKLEESLINFFRSAIEDNGSLRVGKKIDREIHELDHLIYYLKTGQLRWNAVASKSAAQLFKEVLIKQPQLLRESLIKEAKEEKVRKRMIFQFNDDILDEVVHVVAKTDSAYILDHKNKMIQYQTEHTLVDAGPSGFKRAIWQVIFGYLFVESNGYYSKKSYLTYLIKKMASAYNMSYSILLRIIHFGVQNEQNFSDSRGEFKKIILELTAEETSKSIRTENVHSSSKLNNDINWLDSFELYLETGRFPENFYPGSRSELNFQLKKLITIAPATVRSKIDRWFENSNKRERILTTLDNVIVDKLIGLSRLSPIQLRAHFIDELGSQKTELPSRYHSFLDLVLQQRTHLVLRGTILKNATEKDVIHQLLLAILEVFSSQTEQVYQLLIQVQKKLPRTYSMYVLKFLKRFYINLGDVVLKNIAVEINTFGEINDSSVWSVWFKNKVHYWTATTGLSYDKLKDYLQIYDSVSEFPMLGEFLRVVGSDSSMDSSYKGLTRIKENITNLKTSDSMSSRINLVYYIIEKGQKPWWVEQYTWESFNKDFTVFWEDTSIRTELITRLKRHENYRVFKMLSIENTSAIWNEMDPSTSNGFSKFLIELYRLFTQRFQSIGIIKSNLPIEFKVTVFSMLLSSQKQSMKPRLLDWFKKWLLNDTNEAKFDLRLLHDEISTLHKTKESTRFITMLKALLKEEGNQIFLPPQIDSVRISDVRSRLKAIVPELIDERLTIGQQLQSIAIKNPKVLKTLFNDALFRTRIVEQVPEGEIDELIATELSSTQQSLFEVSNAVLEAYKKYLSQQEFQLLKRNYVNLLLLKLGRGGINSWTITDWSNFLFQVLENNLGSNKQQVLLHLIIDEESDNAKTQNKTRAQFVKSIQSLTTSSMKAQSIEAAVEGQKEYKKLGEVTPREFLDPIFITNAGLIILAPYLGMLFERCGLMDKSKFISTEAVNKAVKLLEYAAVGEQISEEHQLVMHKVLCGLPPTYVLEPVTDLADSDKEIVDGLLQAITQQWTALKGSSIDSLRSSFLVREGMLEEEEDRYYLKVEYRAYDMLLDQIPWNISQIKLSWMEKMIQVTWRS